MFAAKRNHNTASFGKVLKTKRRQTATHTSTTSTLPPTTTSPQHAAVDPSKHQPTRQPTTSKPLTSEPASSSEPSISKRFSDRRGQELHTQNISGKTSSRREETAGPQRAKEGHSACSFCGASLRDTWYQCQQCPHCWYCMKCIDNAWLDHPGHHLKCVQDEQRAATEGNGLDSYGGNGADGDSAGGNVHTGLSKSDGQDRLDDGEVPGGSDGNSLVKLTSWVPRCEACHRQLFDLRYQCQDCAGDTNYCSRCRGLHAHHTLKIFTCPIEVSDSSSLDSCSSSDHGEDETVELDEDVSRVDDPGVSGEADQEGSSLSVRQPEVGETDHLAMVLRTHLGTQSQTMFPTSQTGISCTDLAQITDAMANAVKSMQAIVGAAERILCAQGTAIQNNPPQSLLDFPVDFATLDRHDPGKHESDIESVVQSPRKRRRRRPGQSRQWTTRDRRKLHDLKQKGWSDEKIGDALDRSAGAVAQQWRKQS